MLLSVDRSDTAAGGHCTMWHVNLGTILDVDNCLRDDVGHSQLSWHARKATDAFRDSTASGRVTESGGLPGILQSKRLLSSSIVLFWANPIFHACCPVAEGPSSPDQRLLLCIYSTSILLLCPSVICLQLAVLQK